MLVIAVAVVVVYLPAMGGGFIWDDERYVAANPTLRTLEGLWRIWFEVGATIQYYPLLFTSFWCEYQLWEADTLGYHVVNVALHVLNAVLLWFLLRRLSVPGAWLAAAVFALHPVHTESVAWITERKNVLSGLFYLLAVLAYLRFEPPESSVRISRRAWRFYVLAGVCFVCALLSKTATCTLPVVILLVLWWKRKRLVLRNVLPLAPLFGVGIALSLVTVWVERYTVQAQGADWAFSFFERCLIAGRTLCFYAGKLIWPTDLAFIYPRWAIDTGVWWQWLFPSAAVLVIAALWFSQHRMGKAPLVAALLFAGTLAPVLGLLDFFMMRYSFVADHFQYLASIGPIALGVGLLTWACGRMRAAGLTTPAVPAPVDGVRVGAWLASGFLLAALGLLTWRQAHMYNDRVTIWRDTLQKNPECWLAHNNLGVMLHERGELDLARGHYAEALRLRDHFRQAHFNMGRLLVDLAGVDQVVETADEMIEMGIRHLERTLEIRPDVADAHDKLGWALAHQGRQDDAIEHYKTALELNPELYQAHINLASILYDQERFEETLAHYVVATQLEPETPLAYKKLTAALVGRGRIDEAVRAVERLIEIEPNDADAYCNLGILQRTRGRVAEALSAFETALRIDSQHTRARQELSATRAGPNAAGHP